MTAIQRDVTETQDNVTSDAVTNLARARESLRLDVTLSRVTVQIRDSDTERDSDSAPLRCGAVTITPAPAERIEQEKARLSKDPRFASWIAGQPAVAHALLWSQRQNALHIEPVEQMLASNRQAYGENRSTDYAVLWIGSLDLCQATAKNLHGTLAHRAAKSGPAALGSS